MTANDPTIAGMPFRDTSQEAAAQARAAEQARQADQAKRDAYVGDGSANPSDARVPGAGKR
jgi:hypothetical protein